MLMKKLLLGALVPLFPVIGRADVIINVSPNGPIKSLQQAHDVAREAQAKRQVQEGAATIPTTIGDEKLANPFLRADRADVAANVGMAGKPAVDVFAEVRARKNKF